MSYYKITFELDGSGVSFDPNEPIHLDALLAWALAPRQGISNPTRDEVPDLVRLPVHRSKINGHMVWHASALFPEIKGESIWFWRKRFRQGRAEITTGAPNLKNGQYRDWQMPAHLLLCRRMVAYAHGGRRGIKSCLKELKYLGKKRAHGHGKIIRWDIEPCDSDMSITNQGLAMRWLPDINGTRLVRPMPPYWNPNGRINCCEVGDKYRLSN